MLSFCSRYALSDSEYFTKPVGLSLFTIRENSRVYHSRVKVHAISEIGVCLSEVNSFSNRSPPLRIRQIFGYRIIQLDNNNWIIQFVSCKMSGDNFLDKSSLTFLCSRHSHRYFQTIHFSTVKVPSSCSTFEHKTDILYHSYTMVMQLDFHLDLTDLTVRFSRPFSNSLHAASPTQSSFSPILTCLTTNFFFKRTPSAIFRKSCDIKELFDKMENTDLVARVCICST